MNEHDWLAKWFEADRDEPGRCDPSKLVKRAGDERPASGPPTVSRPLLQRLMKYKVEESPDEQVYDSPRISQP
jgi:hypothetical protein